MVERYLYSVTCAEETGFAVVSCTDTLTGMVVRTPLAASDKSFPTVIAYAGARFSRSRGGMVQLLSEIEAARLEGKASPEKRLGNIVRGLKHQSPGGMAHVAVAVENVPLITVASLFRRTTLHDGQESSTRYIDFASGNDLPDLKTLLPDGAEVSSETVGQYSDLQKKSLELYLEWFPRVYEAYKKHFKIDEANKDEKSALTARSYDTVRGFLLSGFKTSVIYVTNATTMQQMLADFGADRLPGERQLSQALLALLAPVGDVEMGNYLPEIRTLLNHTEPNLRTRDEQKELMGFLNRQTGFNDLLKMRRSFNGLVENTCQLIPESINMADRVITQQIMVINPALNLDDVAVYVKKLNDEQRAEIGKIIFSRRDRFSLPAIAASGGPIGFNYQIDLGIERDLGRHRAWERVSPIHETYVGLGEIPETGFTQVAYLRQIPEMVGIQRGMERDTLDFYEKRSGFLAKLESQIGAEATNRIGMYLLPLAHQVGMVMNGDLRYMVHLQDIRIREGAHIDARLVVASANRQVADSNPLYRSLAYSTDRVMVDDRLQFISRD